MGFRAWEFGVWSLGGGGGGGALGNGETHLSLLAEAIPRPCWWKVGPTSKKQLIYGSQWGPLLYNPYIHSIHRGPFTSDPCKGG